MAFRVYTKTGDKGTTALIGGVRVPKTHIRIEAYGTIDELNSYIGLVKDSFDNVDAKAQLQEIQDRLFTIGAVLATPPDKDVKMSLPDLLDTDVTFLEQAIDKMDDQLPPLQSFVLPGGNVVSSYAHLARCVCRRAERICVAIEDGDTELNALVLRYLNRLSDYLFVLARYILYTKGITDIPWKPRVV
jgi:cob(I)alamin adenosyltransferase